MLSSVGAGDGPLRLCSGRMNTVIFFVVRLRWKWVNVITKVCIRIHPALSCHNQWGNCGVAFVNARRACSPKKERRRFRDRQKFLFVVLVANFCNNPRYMCSPRHPPALSFSGACMHIYTLVCFLPCIFTTAYSAMKRSHCSLHYKSIVEKSSLFTVSGFILPIPIIRLQISKCSSSQRPGILLALPGLKTELAYYTTEVIQTKLLYLHT